MFRSPSHLVSAAASSTHSSVSSNPASPASPSSMEPDFGAKSTFEQLLEAEAQGLKEERFRIDRKKLEDMIQTPPTHGFNGTIENADVFFQRVMLETSTQISWPSKLKIGAKSKKDPHVKVVGQQEAVQMAKEQILEILDTKKDRVTLKMDVSHSDHSYVIGKGGFKIQQVMEETGCHIHFPDSNRSSSSAAEKSNQVSVAGQAAGVELARAKIRDLLPLEFSFELPGGQQSVKPGDECSPAIQHIQQTYSFNVSFRPLGLGHTLLLVRGCQRLLPRLRQGLALLMEYLTGSKAIPVMGFMQTEIAAQHQPFVQGPCNANTQTIMNKTGARILFPEPPAQFPSPGGTRRSKSTVVIQGSFDGVCLAWQELLKHLPMVLMFDLKEGQELDPVMVNSYMEAFSISIMVRPKIKDNTKSVLIRGAEKDSRILFQIRKDILGLEDDSSSIGTSSFKQTPHFPTIDTFRRHSDFKEPGNLTAESLNILSSILHPQVLGLLNKLPPFPHPQQPPPFRMNRHNRHFPTRSVENWIDRNRDYSAGASGYLQKDGRLEDGDSGIFLPTTNRFFGGYSARFESTKSELSSRAESSASSCSSNDTPDSRFAERTKSTDVHDLLADYGGKRLAANHAMRQSVEGGVRRPSRLWSGCGFSKSTPDFARRAKESGSISEFLETGSSSAEPAAAKPWATEKSDNPLEQVPSPFGMSNFWEHLPRLPPVDYSSIRSLEDLLLLINLESYMEVFWHNEIDLTIFLTLTEMDLQQLNISYGARRKMLTAISAVREQQGDWSRSFLAAPGAERKFSSSRLRDSARVEEHPEQIAAPRT